MRIIFQNGEIAEINNVESIVIHNDLEHNILEQALTDYCTKEGTPREQYTSSKTVCDELISEHDVASQGS